MSDRPFFPPSRDELQRRSAREFVHAVKLLAFAAGDADLEVRAKRNRVTERVQQIAKAAVAGRAFDTGALTAYGESQTAWVASLRQAGVFDRLLSAMIPLPVLGVVHVSTVSYVATETPEVGVKQVFEATVSPGEPLPERKVAAVTTLSKELETWSSITDLLDRELSAAVIAGVDATFLADLLAATTPIASTGSVADVDALLGAVALGNASAPYFILAMDVARTMSTERTSGIRLWPELGVLGGSINGIAAIATDQLAAGTALLVDAASIAGNAGRVELSRSGSADIFSPAGVDRLWQLNRVGIRCERFFAYSAPLRADAVASVAGVGGP